MATTIARTSWGSTASPRDVSLAAQAGSAPLAHTVRPGIAPRLSCLVDTNVLLDVVLRREPWATDAARLLSAIEREEVRGFIAAHAVTTVYYIVEKGRGRQAAVLAVGDLIETCAVVPIGAPELQRAVALGVPDFEDGVQAAAYLASGADYIATRNGRDFAGAPVAVRTPGELLALLGYGGGADRG